MAVEVTYVLSSSKNNIYFQPVVPLFKTFVAHNEMRVTPPILDYVTISCKQSINKSCDYIQWRTQLLIKTRAKIRR